MKKILRILHVLTAMNMAGTETLLMNFYRNVDRDLVQFDFAVTTKTHCDYDDEILSLGGRIIHYPKYTGKNHFIYKRWWRDFLASHPEYIIVHGHIGSTAAIYLRIAKKMGRYTIAHSHSTHSTLSLISVLYKMYSYPTRFIADQFFGCSKKAIIDRYGEKIANDKTKSRVINNAIDAKRFIFNPERRKTIREEYKVSDNIFVIGTVGRLTPPKNPHEIIRICEELRSRNIDYMFWWFGAGEMEEEIKALIDNKNLDDCVMLMGVRSDIYCVLQGMDIFIFPSIWEGLGIACVEAQAAGLPTLCSDTIPFEAKVTQLVRFLPLNETNTWCDVIEETRKKICLEDYKRPNTYMEIVEAGYDIESTTAYLQSFYLRKAYSNNYADD